MLTLGNNIGGGEDSQGTYIYTGGNQGEERRGEERTGVVREQTDVPL
jgi:hypothetical protein